MMNLVGLYLCTDRPQELAAFYRQVLQREPVWRSEAITIFMLGDIRLEIMGHSEVAGPNRQPQRSFFDLSVDDVPAEFERIVGLGAAVVQEPYDFADDQIRLTLATLADIDGNYFQLVSTG
jgi:predicted enzyme related to lactoylglutathione lyase